MGRRTDENRPPRQLAPGRPARGQRLLFATALVAVALASAYSAVATLTRVTPALVKGKNLDVPVVSAALEGAPGSFAVKKPGAESSLTRRENILIIGVDRRPKFPDNLPYNTDTIMVASVDPLTKSVNILSFPRDLWVDIHPADGSPPYKGRINSSYGSALLDGTRPIRDGAEQLKRDLKADFDIDIDHWVWMDIAGVEKLVTAVGGVTLDIPEELAFFDWWYTNDDKTNPHRLSIPPGTGHYDGYDAVAFGRYREDSDLNRIKRQQLVLLATIQAALDGGVFNTSAPDLWAAYNSVFRHDFSLAEAGSYLPLMRTAARQVTMFSIGEPVAGVQTVTDETIGGKDILLYDRDNAAFWVDVALNRPNVDGSSVEVRDGSGAAGQDRADQIGRYLRDARHLSGVALGPDVAPTPQTTVTVYDDARRPMATQIAQWLGLPGTSVVTAPRTGRPTPDIVITVGSEQRIPAN